MSCSDDSPSNVEVSRDLDVALGNERIGARNVMNPQRVALGREGQVDIGASQRVRRQSIDGNHDIVKRRRGSKPTGRLNHERARS